jgi:hypothetical protein
MADFGTEALGLLGAIAPTIATALGGPLAGIAVRALGSALGLPDGTPPEAVATAISAASPDQLLALRRADQAFGAQMKQLDVDFEKVEAGDRASARAREISVHDPTPAVLAYAVTAGFFALLGLLAFRGVPEANASAVNILLGALGTAWITAMTYYFGSSSGSKTKDAMLFQSMPAPTATVASALLPAMAPARGAESPGENHAL